MRQASEPAKASAGVAAGLGVAYLLAPTTPGPVAGAGWRVGISVLAGAIAVVVAHLALERRRDRQVRGLPPLSVLATLRVTLAAAAIVVVVTFGLLHLASVLLGVEAVREPTGLSVSLLVDAPLLLGSALLLMGVVAAALGERIRVPTGLLFLFLGMAVGKDGLGLVVLDDPGLVQSVGVAALVVLLFDGGLGTTPTQLRVGLAPGVVLATVGVVVTTSVTAFGAMLVLDVDPALAWLLGAIVASTDPTAVFAVLRRSAVPDRVGAILRVEAGANDPVAILLAVGLLAAWDAPQPVTSWLAFGGVQLVGGIVVGLGVGGFGAVLLRRITLTSSGLYSILGLALAGVSYGVAAAFGGSGFLATFVVGLVLGIEVPRRRVALRSFVRTLAGGVEVGLFLLLGLLVLPSDLPGVVGVSLGVSFLLVLVARPLAVASCLGWFGIHRREQAAISWLGMRGAVPIVLATLAFSADLPQADLVFDVVFFVVVISTVVQGLAAPRVMAWLDLHDGGGPAPTVADVLPLDDIALDLVEVELTDESALVGRQLDATHPPADVLVLAVRRRGRVVLPRGPTDLRPGDLLVVATTDQVHGRRRVESWVAGETFPKTGGHEGTR